MHGRILRVSATGIAVLLLAIVHAAAQPAEDGRPGALALLPPGDAVTEHVAQVDGEDLAYTARAGTLTLRNESGEPLAAVFYTAYAMDDAAPEDRPVTFVFNGGPGASAAYLHLGLVGPRVADFGEPPDGARARLVANPDNWLPFTDLVLIDPVGTGWSRAAKPDDARSFWTVNDDARSIAKAIALYLAQNGRTASPKYLLGESYGAYRAVKVARALQREQGIVAAGIVAVSPFLDGARIGDTSKSALNAALLLPSIAAAELDRNDRFTEEALAEAERFAMTDYLVTLAGPRPEGDAADRFYERVARISGLSTDAVRRTRGFVGRPYLEQAGQRRGNAVSPYDAAFIAPDAFPASGSARGADPILDGYLQALGNLFVGYARNRLGFETDMTYTVLNREVSRRWKWGSGGRAGADATDDLRELLALNPSFRLLAVHGRSDLVTPYATTRYLLDHLPRRLAERARLEVYEGGHMFYYDGEARSAFTADAQAFYRHSGE